MSLCYKYGRASTLGQLLSPEYQNQECDRYHSMNERLPPLFQEMFFDRATSGSTSFADRPAAHQLLLRLKRGDHVIVAAFDRLGRDQVDMISTVRLLHKRGVFVHIMDMLFIASMDPEDPTTEIMLSQFASFSQFVRKQISIKTKQAKAAQKAMGISVAGTGCSVGYKKFVNPLWREGMTKEEVRAIGGHYRTEPCPHSQDYFDKAYALWQAGNKIPAIMRNQAKHIDAPQWSYKRLREALLRENKKREDELMRQQRNYFMRGGEKPKP